MSRALITVSSTADRDRVCAWAQKAPTGTRIEFKAAKRTLPQNDRMWAMLTDIAQQKEHAGRKYTPDQWKIIFMHACGREVQFIPALDGANFIPWGQSSSDLSKQEMSDLIEFMFSWGAENGVEFHDPQDTSAPADAEAAAGIASSAASLHSSRDAAVPQLPPETDPAPGRSPKDVPGAGATTSPDGAGTAVSDGEPKQAGDGGAQAVANDTGLPVGWQTSYAAALSRAKKVHDIGKRHTEWFADKGGFIAHRHGPDGPTITAIFKAFQDHFGPAGEEARNVILHELGALP